MKYWDAVLNEVLHKNDDNYPFVFTNIRNPEALEEQQRQDARRSRRKRSKSNSKASSHIAVGFGYPDVSFTKRESDAMMLLINGKTVDQTAKQLKLATRTVEYYVKNMKVKIGVAHKDQLVAAIEKTDFVNNYQQAQK